MCIDTHIYVFNFKNKTDTTFQLQMRIFEESGLFEQFSHGYMILFSYSKILGLDFILSSFQ